MLSQLNVECYEQVHFVYSGTVTAPAGVTGAVSITKVTPTIVDPGVVITFNGATFNVEGEYSDIFPRVIRYLSADGTPSTVTHWRDVPSTFRALYQYVAPSTEVILNPVSIEYKVGSSATYTDTFTINIRHNWQSDIASIKSMSSSGQYYQYAKDHGRSP